MDFFVDLTSVGTFFAFILVCAGVLYMDHSGLSKQSKFRVPYINGKYLISLGFIIAWALIWRFNQEAIQEWQHLDFIYILEHKVLILIFWTVWIILAIMAYKYNFSLLPVIGILINLYLMTELGTSNWVIFLIWLAIGLVVYFFYGYKNSRLNNPPQEDIK